MKSERSSQAAPFNLTALLPLRFSVNMDYH